MDRTEKYEFLIFSLFKSCSPSPKLICLFFKLRIMDFFGIMLMNVSNDTNLFYDRVCFIITWALGRRELGSRVLGVQYSGIFCCVLFISTELQNMDSGSSNRERCTLHSTSGQGARNMKYVSMYHQYGKLRKFFIQLGII